MQTTESGPPSTAQEKPSEAAGGSVRKQGHTKLVYDKATRTIVPRSINREAGDENPLNGNRSLPWLRDDLGRMVREAWVRWAETQPNPKASWLVPYHELSETDKEADRQIGEAVARWTLIGDATRFALIEEMNG
jgi:hypothetical protein